MGHSVKLKDGPQFYFPDDIDVARQIQNYKNNIPMDPRVRVLSDDSKIQNKGARSVIHVTAKNGNQKEKSIWDTAANVAVNGGLAENGATSLGIYDMIRNFLDMRRANVATNDTDKYFHCKANYQATRRGPEGQAAAGLISHGREIADGLAWWKNDTAADAKADHVANRRGRWGANNGLTLQQTCGHWRNKDIPDRY